LQVPDPAFCLGIGHIMLLQYGIPDLRAFFEQDIRWPRRYVSSVSDVPKARGGMRMLIKSLFDDEFIVVLIGFLALEAMYFISVWCDYAFPRRKEDFRRRMGAYAELKKGNETEASCQCKKETSCPGVLPPAAHEVLLGTLKKVEQKSAVNTTILVFALTISLVILLQPTLPSLPPQVKNLVLTFVSLLILPTFLAFRGTYQLDQLDFPGCSNNGFCLKKRMQDDLIKDLLEKERAFRFTRNSTMYTIIGLLLIVVLDGIYTALCYMDLTSFPPKNQLFLAIILIELMPE